MKNSKERELYTKRSSLTGGDDSMMVGINCFEDGCNAASNIPVRLKIDLQLDTIKEFSSIMQMVIDKISSLKLDKPIESCKVNLQALPPLGAKKIAILDIFINGNQFLTESKSSRWDNAFLNAFDHFCSKVNS